MGARESRQTEQKGHRVREVPQGSRGGDDLQLLQMPTDDGEELEWIHYTPTTSLGKEIVLYMYVYIYIYIYICIYI